MGLAPKTWKMLSSVQNETPWWSGQARLGQVMPGYVMQSYLDLKVHFQRSACPTEATYQISCQSGPRAQSNHCRYINRLRAFNHFRYLSVHRNRYLKKVLKCPPFFLSILHGETWSMQIFFLFFFSSRHNNLKMHFFLLWPWNVKCHSVVMNLSWLIHWWSDY